MATAQTLNDILHPYETLSLLPVVDPNFHLVLAVRNPAAFMIDHRMSGKRLANFRSRLVYLENKDRVVSVHGLFLAGRNHPPNRSLDDFKNTSVKSDVFRELKKYLTDNPDRIRELQTCWVDLNSWKPGGFSKPISVAEVVRFEFIVNEYLVHGIPMGIRINRYIDIALDAFACVKADEVLKNNFMGDFEMPYAFLENGNGQRFADVQIQHKFISSSPPFPSGMRFRCTGDGICCWSELRYSFRHDSDLQFINTGNFGLSCNISSHKNHQQVAMMTFKDRLALQY